MKKNCFILILSTLLLLTTVTSCKKNSTLAMVMNRGNIFINSLPEMPKSMNYFIDNNSTSATISSLLYESLTEQDGTTLERLPRLAKSWSISPDKMTFTFVLDERAVWTDGSPVTADDVLFTWETIMNPDNLTGMLRVVYESTFESVTKVDDQTVRFKALEKRWTGFDYAAGFTVIPKAQYEGKDFNKDFNFRLPDGSGPYKIDKVEADRFITLVRRDNWWGESLENKKNKYRFETIKYKFIGEQVRYEALKKGDIDALPIFIAKKWHQLTEAERPSVLNQNWVLARKVYNYSPKITQHFYMNLHNKKFQDIRVRMALGLLLNIELINDKLMYNAYDPLRSYFPTHFNSDKSLPLIGYDPGEARRLLTEAGWDQVDTDGVLLNADGERFEVEFVLRSETSTPHLTIFKEDCKKVGVQINIVQVAPASWRNKVMIDHDFDMTWMAWGGSLFPSIDSLWRGSYADEKNTNNFGGFKNERIDALIDKYLLEFDQDKRLVIMQTIDHILVEEMPTILLWAPAYSRVLYWNKFETSEHIFSKYSDEDDVFENWAISQPENEALIEAIKAGTALPEEAVNVYYDEFLQY